MGHILRPDSGHQNGTALEVFIRKQMKTYKAGRFWCPESGRKMCPIFRPQNPHNQAQAVWQWYNCCAARVPAGKAPLRINMDETSVCLFQGGGKGTVVFKRRRDPGDEPYEQASRAKRRTCFTHAAFICDRPDIQPLLPQVLVGNEATLLVRDFAALQAALPRNVHLIRQKSAWNNKQLMARIITMLALALRPYLDALQPILLLDAARIHIPATVLSRCLYHKIWPIIVPAKLTWLLQPCDTHAFSRFKVYLKKAYQAAIVRAASGELNVAEFLSCMYSAIRHVLQGIEWDQAFDADGFGHSQERLSERTRKQLHITSPWRVPATLPTEELMKLCFPRRAIFPYQALLRPLQPPPSPAAVPKAAVGYRLASGSTGPRATLSVAAAALPTMPGAGPSAGLAMPLTGRAPRTRADHRLVAALARGRPAAP
jgi:hypothetical protein